MLAFVRAELKPPQVSIVAVIIVGGATSGIAIGNDAVRNAWIAVGQSWSSTKTIAINKQRLAILQSLPVKLDASQ